MSNRVLICRRCGFATSCRDLGDRCPTDGALLLPRQSLVEGRRDPAVGRLLAGRFLTLGGLVRHDVVTVYRGRDLVTDEPVCIKTVPPYAVGAPERVTRLTAESRLLRQLQHATLPRFVAGGREADGLVWTIQGGLRGVSLRALLTERGPLPPNRAINITLRVLAALDRLHGFGRVHGDLQPESILITPRGLRGNDEIRLLDVGSTALAGVERAARSTDEGLRYRAPELLAGQPAEVTADVYTAGALLFEMLTGRPPFGRRSAFEPVEAQRRGPVPSIGLPPEYRTLEGVVRRALEEAPERRWRQARAMAIALKAAFVTRGDERPVKSSSPPPIPPPEARADLPTRPGGRAMHLLMGMAAFG